MALIGPPKPRLPIGISDFCAIRREGYTYVDKTQYIQHVIDVAGKSLLFPRPRRFGKTLGLSTLRYFFGSGTDDYTDLFKGTYIWDADHGSYRDKHFAKHPVVFLTFKDVKTSTWQTAWKKIGNLIRLEMLRLVNRHDLAGIIEQNAEDSAWFNAALVPDAVPEDIEAALANLVRWLHQATGQSVVLLIDEYDAPMHAAYEYGYWDEAVTFFRAFLTAGYKDTTPLFRGVLSGILKVAKENIFSGLNNVSTYSILADEFSEDFGFDEAEVQQILRTSGLEQQSDAVRRWYNGYRFGESRPVTMYNPWSVSNFAQRPGNGPRSFWSNTSDNVLLRELLLRYAASETERIEALLRGESIEVDIGEDVILRDVYRSTSMMWALLTFSGYVTPESFVPQDTGFAAVLRVPNVEVLGIFKDIYRRMLPGSRATGPAKDLTRALLSGNAHDLQRYLRDVLKNVMSYYDFGGDKPIEAIYQAFVMGLLVHLQDTHAVRSNRESGYGRADVLIIPREPGPGAVMELKVIDTDDEETPEQAVDSALEQVLKMNYAAEVQAAEAEPVWVYGIVFNGKRCWVKRGERSSR